MTALVGHGGAGKSTILNLIPRFMYIPKENINRWTICGRSFFKIYKKNILVSQDTTLFDDTIKNILNIQI